ncbi:hypothetical protein CYY_002874 [Polysphondylium violaceum]|uniref:histidine kinase n=1 Tax=Polysphondylium violaceum TaxID=133409 RepID=A0A8J4V0K5_9MYCE|nr:hypothetical protein CYY_002874 [Polysphondylium violaceum]
MEFHNNLYGIDSTISTTNKEVLEDKKVSQETTSPTPSPIVLSPPPIVKNNNNNIILNNITHEQSTTHPLEYVFEKFRAKSKLNRPSFIYFNNKKLLADHRSSPKNRMDIEADIYEQILSIPREEFFVGMIQCFKKVFKSVQSISISQVTNGNSNCKVLAKLSNGDIVTSNEELYDIGSLVDNQHLPFFIENNYIRIPLYTTKLYGEIKVYPISMQIAEKIRSDLLFKFVIKHIAHEVEYNFNEEVKKMILELSFASTSDEFFTRFSKEICKIFNSTFAGISVYKKGKFKTVAFCNPYQSLDNFEYQLKETNRFINYYENIYDIFINKDIIEKFDVTTYMDVPLFDSRRNYIGDIIILNDKEMDPNILNSQLVTFISNRTSLELERREVQEELVIAKTLLDQSPTCSLLVNREGAITRSFGSFNENLFGFKEGDNIKTFEKDKEITKILKEICKEKNDIVVETEITNIKTGSTFPAEVFIKEIFNENKSLGLMVIIRDISDKQVLEAMNKELQALSQQEIKKNQELVEARDRALAAIKVKSQFMATISHEIRTPMNGVIGMAEMLLMTDLSPQQLDIAETIYRSGDLLLSITSDILDFSKIEASRMELELVEFNFLGCVEGIVNTISVSVGEKPIEMVILMEKDVPLKVIGDPNRLGQILLNLGYNAIKYTNEGYIFIHISVVNRFQNKVKLKISIQDTGIGISKDKASFLFEPFYQGDSSTTRKYGGTGLGLAIVKRLSNLMGGDVELEKSDEVDQKNGSTFNVTLVFEEIEDEATSCPLILSNSIQNTISSMILLDTFPFGRQIAQKKFKQIVKGSIHTTCYSAVERLLSLGDTKESINITNQLDKDLVPYLDDSLCFIALIHRYNDSITDYIKIAKKLVHFYSSKIKIILFTSRFFFKKISKNTDYHLLTKPIFLFDVANILGKCATIDKSSKLNVYFQRYQKLIKNSIDFEEINTVDKYNNNVGKLKSCTKTSFTNIDKLTTAPNSNLYPPASVGNDIIDNMLVDQFSLIKADSPTLEKKI